jgi:hypothetical protein
MTVVQGDVVSGDPMATAWQPIVKAVLDHVQPGSIVVLDITQGKAKMTDQALTDPGWPARQGTPAGQALRAARP